jgi:ABC-type transport system involved in multi-copper enzyme maturation permease subunit
MTALVRAELLKLRSTRLPLGLLLGTLAMVAVTIAVSVPQAATQDVPLTLDDPRLLAVVVGESLGVPQVMAVLLGVLTSTQEHRYGTATSTYLVEPRRTRVLVAKCLSSIIGGLAIAVVSLAFSVVATLALIRFRDGDVTAGTLLWQVLAAGLLVLAMYGVIGVAIGAVVRNQVAAVVAVLVWMLAVEYLLLPAVPSIGRWTPLGATTAWLQIGPSLDLSASLLSTPVAGLVLLCYTVAAAALALVVAPRRDVL